MDDHDERQLSRSSGHAEAVTDILSLSPGATTTAPQTAARTAAARAHIPSLDGLRFFAALFVLLGHSFLLMIVDDRGQPTRSVVSFLIGGLPSAGMTLFFVLSGFVIHVNYFRTAPIGATKTGTADFFIARFARLYPLFIVLFAIVFVGELWRVGYLTGQPISGDDVLGPIAPMLTFTSTWWLWPIGDQPVYNDFSQSVGGMAGLWWSLSTEAFFYLVYPFVGGFIGRLRGPALYVVAILVMLAGIGYYVACISGDWIPWLVSQGVFRFRVNDVQAWFTFHSPWGRIFEFLLGVMAAQFWIRSTENPGKGLSESTGQFVTYLVAAAWLISIWVSLVSSAGSMFLAIGTSCFAVLYAALMYFTARYASPVATFFSNRLMVIAGNASYSLYLLHWYISHDIVVKWTAGQPEWARYLIWFFDVALCIAVAILSYRLFERHATRWVRANFRRFHFGAILPALTIAVVGLSVIGSMTSTALQRATSLPVPDRLSIESASFGENCNAKLSNNALGMMRQICNGQGQCTVDYDVNRLGDPAGGCFKNFDVHYTCDAGRTDLAASVPATTAITTMTLSCQAGAGKPVGQ